MFVTGLHSHSLQVPDLAAGVDFYRDFGLTATADGPLGTVRCEGRDTEQIVLREGPDKRMQSVAFTIEPGARGELRRRLAAAGHPEVDGLPGRGDGLWVRDNDGLLVQFIEGAPSPYREFPRVARNFDGAAERVDDARWLRLARPQPRRLGHVIKFTADLAAAEHFYCDVVGLKLSDRVAGALSFWNHGHGGDHHIFGAIQSSHPGLHHASFEVADFDEMGMGAQHMAERGHSKQWGLGRHTFGSNLFTYIQDPWGSWVEYFSDMDVITCNWQGRTWEAPPATWGPALPGEFLLNQEPAG
jgi:catechol 2,3-dioxygenase-like lactoylglutathione lyase family enzyme